MQSIYPYLTFNGNCREAMQFYQQCLGGSLVLQTIGEMPHSEKMPRRMKNCILHATLKNKNIVLAGSDIVPETGINKGNAVSLVLTFRSKIDVESCYKKLSAGGVQTSPPAITHYGALFGSLTDKFGNHWLLGCKILNNKKQALRGGCI